MMDQTQYALWWERATDLLETQGALPEPIQTLARHVEALQARIDALMDPDDHDQLHGPKCRCTYVRCVCAYDHPDAVCLVHYQRAAQNACDQAVLGGHSGS